MARTQTTNSPVQRSAVLSDCGRFRYRLTRRWANGPTLLFVILNPSTADASRDDATVRRCTGFARSHGFGALEVVNIFAWRATSPRALKAAGFPVGPDNDRQVNDGHIAAAARQASTVCVAWGVQASRLERPRQVLALLQALGVKPMALAVADDGSPAHPLMLPGSRTMAPYAALLAAHRKSKAAPPAPLAAVRTRPSAATLAAAAAAAATILGSVAVAQPSVPAVSDRAQAPLAPQVPSLAMDPRRSAGAIDLSTLAQQYERMRLGPSAGGADADLDRQAKGLVVFVSLGLPAATLDRLIADAERLRAPLILRGITGGSIKTTAQRIEQLNAGRKVGWQIDPAMFKRFDVRAVPAFVLVDPARPVTVDCSGAAGAAGAVPRGADVPSAALGSACRADVGGDALAFSKVTGDVSFGHALAEIERADPPFAEVARRYATRLKTTGGAR